MFILEVNRDDLHSFQLSFFTQLNWRVDRFYETKMVRFFFREMNLQSKKLHIRQFQGLWLLCLEDFRIWKLYKSSKSKFRASEIVKITVFDDLDSP